MNSSDIEFLSAMELESLWQTEELNRSDNVEVAKMMETPLPLENMNLTLSLLCVANPELQQKDGMKSFMCFNSKVFD